MEYHASNVMVVFSKKSNVKIYDDSIAFVRPMNSWSYWGIPILKKMVDSIKSESMDILLGVVTV